MKLSPESLARSSARHPWRTVIVWLVALVAAGALASTFLGDALTTSQDFTDEPESKRAAAALEQRLRGSEQDTEFVLVTSAVLGHRPRAAGPRARPATRDRRARARRREPRGELPERRRSDLRVGNRDAPAGDAGRRRPHGGHRARGTAGRHGGSRRRAGRSRRHGRRPGHVGERGHRARRGGAAAGRDDRHPRRARGGGLRVRGGRGRAASRRARRRGDRDRPRRRGVDRAGLRPVVHHRADHLDDRPRGRHRLLAVHRVPLPRGARERPREGRGDRARRGDGRQGRALLGADRRAGADRHAAVAEHDLPQHRRGCDGRRAGRRDRLAHPAARRAVAARRSGRCAAHPRPQDGGHRSPRPHLGPHRGHGHAPTRRERGARRGSAAARRAPRLQHPRGVLGREHPARRGGLEAGVPRAGARVLGRPRIAGRDRDRRRDHAVGERLDRGSAGRARRRRRVRTVGGRGERRRRPGGGLGAARRRHGR